MTSKTNKFVFYRLRSVRPLSDYRLAAEFRNGITKIFDIAPWFDKFPEFKRLQKNNLFKRVFLDPMGIGVRWTRMLDHECNTLYYEGKKVKTPFDDLVMLDDALSWWKLKEETLKEAIEKGDLLDNIDVRKFGKVTLLSRKAIIRLFGPQKTEY